MILAMSRIQRKSAGVKVRPRRNELIEFKQALAECIDRKQIARKDWRNEPYKKGTRNKEAS